MADYPMPKFHFSVEWTPETKIGFTEVTGLTMESEVIEYRSGDSPEFHKIKQPGLQKLSNITLKRGTFAGNTEFNDWMATISMNKVERRTVTIKLLNEEHQPVLAWEVHEAWPVKVQASDMKADGNEVAIETMELAHEGIKLIK
ncbi:MAG TPA: phage tail protein [Chitinophagaceae bacterium]|jgi:phage tail-like protein|nr:phage tail protein [Chitinophagaceae bacterium]